MEKCYLLIKNWGLNLLGLVPFLLGFSERIEIKIMRHLLLVFLISVSVTSPQPWDEAIQWIFGFMGWE